MIVLYGIFVVHDLFLILSISFANKSTLETLVNTVLCRLLISHTVFITPLSFSVQTNQLVSYLCISVYTTSFNRPHQRENAISDMGLLT